MDTSAVTVTPEAAAYLRARGGSLTLRRSPRHGCCGGSVALPVAEAARPADTDGFERFDLDVPGGPLAVFVEAGLEAGGALRVGLDRLLGLASLYVEGAEAQM